MDEILHFRNEKMNRCGWKSHMAELSVHAALGDETFLPLVSGFHFLERHTFL